MGCKKIIISFYMIAFSGNFIIPAFAMNFDPDNFFSNIKSKSGSISFSNNPYYESIIFSGKNRTGKELNNIRSIDFLPKEIKWVAAGEGNSEAIKDDTVISGKGFKIRRFFTFNDGDDGSSGLATVGQLRKLDEKFTRLTDDIAERNRRINRNIDWFLGAGNIEKGQKPFFVISGALYSSVRAAFQGG